MTWLKELLRELWLDQVDRPNKGRVGMAGLGNMYVTESYIMYVVEKKVLKMVLFVSCLHAQPNLNKISTQYDVEIPMFVISGADGDMWARGRPLPPARGQGNMGGGLRGTAVANLPALHKSEQAFKVGLDAMGSSRF